MIKRSSSSSPCAPGTGSESVLSPQSPISFFPGWNETDIRLFHHYSTFTSGTLSLIKRRGVSRIVAFELPRLALEYDFIMHCILGIASLHLQYLTPEVPEYQSLAIAHRVNALNGLRMTISQLSKSSYKAMVAGSLFVIVLSSNLSEPETSGDLWIGNWLGLWAGLREIVRVISWKFVEESGLAPIFARDEDPRRSLENMPFALSDILLSMDPDSEDTNLILRTLSCLSKLYQELLRNGLTEEFTTRVIVWPASTDVVGFAGLTKRKNPQALIIAAYYLVFSKLVNEIWWMADVSGREIEAIAYILPIEYHSHMIVPLQAVHLRSKWDIASLLLSQLPGGSLYDDNLNCTVKPFSGRARDLLPAEEIG